MTEVAPNGSTIAETARRLSGLLRQRVTPPDIDVLLALVAFGIEAGELCGFTVAQRAIADRAGLGDDTLLVRDIVTAACEAGLLRADKRLVRRYQRYVYDFGPAIELLAAEPAEASRSNVVSLADARRRRRRTARLARPVGPDDPGPRAA